MPTAPLKKRITFISLAGVALLAVLAALGLLAEKSGRLAKQSHLDSGKIVDLNGVTYTVTKFSHTNRIQFAEAGVGRSFLVVDLKVKNPKPIIVKRHMEDFIIFDSEGRNFNGDIDATMWTTHGVSRYFRIMPKLSRSITVAFTVLEKNLNQPWTLLIQGENDKTSPAMIKLGSAIETLAQD
jgi:hypothetical protein